jgi:DNA-binding transcriptional MerR regulator
MTDAIGVSQAARILNVHPSRVHQLEKSGLLTAFRDALNRRRFSRADVEALARNRLKDTRTNVSRMGPRILTGEVIAEVFRMFDEEADLRHVVRELRLTPDEVRQLWREYTTPVHQPSPNGKPKESKP